MLLGLIRYVKGSVFFRAEGRSPERFLNLAARNGVNIWDAQPTAKGIEGFMSVRDYRHIRPLARKASVRARILSKHGLPFFAAKYKPRIGIPIGAAAGLALLIFLSNFIWTIDIAGEKRVSESALRGLLAESGVHIGAHKHTADTGQARRDILLKVDEIGWLSVNIVGCHATVEVREKTEKPPLDNSMPCNLKANADGVITKIIADEGIAQVKTGSGAAKGDLLVSGVTVTKNNKVRYVRARGEVYADVISKKELYLPKSYGYISLSENKASRRRLSFLGFELPCSLSFRSFDDAVYTRDSSFLNLNGQSLPLGFVTETSRELVRKPVTYDRQKAERVFQRELLLYEIFEKGSSRLASKELTIDEIKDGFTCSAKFVFNENIAESVDFSVEE